MKSLGKLQYFVVTNIQYVSRLLCQYPNNTPKH